VLVEVEAEKLVIERIRGLHDEDVSMRQIAALLNREGGAVEAGRRLAAHGRPLNS
jgi:IS30 family transposase